ncbi:MAG: hypothetical protein M1818_002454 [Claussenomyces sp. TS43310]|nr:MAG: hypothetical protein M1818_002454 [Claussenomyces sp. TS43310]
MEEKYVENRTARGWTKAKHINYNPFFQHIEGDWNDPEKINVLHNNYSTDKVGDYAYGYLKEALKDTAPFFIGIAPIAPHSQVGQNPGPPVPAHKNKDKFTNIDIPPADNWNPPNRSGVNLVWAADKLNDHQVDILQNHYRRRTEALLSVDELVENVVNILQDANELNNTYIVYTSDNGFHLGHHRLGIGKKYAFEEIINVPFIIRGPGVPKNKTTDVVSAHIDLSPTFLDMAGIPQHADFDGTPMPYKAADIEAKESSGNDEHTNVEFWTGASYKMQKNITGRRVNSYRSLRLAGNGYGIMYAVQCHNNSHELYNMIQDPVQMRNLDPSAPALTGHQNAYQSGEDKLAGYDITALLNRIDALLLVLKSCKANECLQPWKQLHLSGNVKSLRDAMGKEYDQMYEKITKVEFRKCFKTGKIDLWAEGPQWNQTLDDTTDHLRRQMDGNKTGLVIFNADADEEMIKMGDSGEELKGDETGEGGEEGWEEAYWDDWE